MVLLLLLLSTLLAEQVPESSKSVVAKSNLNANVNARIWPPSKAVQAPGQLMHKRALSADKQLVLYKRQPVEFIQRPIRNMYSRLENSVAKTVADEQIRRPEVRPGVLQLIPEALNPYLHQWTMYSVKSTIQSVCGYKNSNSMFSRDLGKMMQNQLIALNPDTHNNFLLRWALHLVFNIMCLLRKYS